MTFGTKAANQFRDDDRAVDTGPREREQRNGGIEIAPRQVLDAGGLTMSVGARAKFECVLDVLLERGLLAGTQGSRDDRKNIARSRFDAGIRLRRLFLDAGLVGVKAFDPEASRGKATEMSDAQALARREFNALMKRLGPYGTIALAPCCFDQMPDNDRWLGNVRRALDELCLVVL